MVGRPRTLETLAGLNRREEPARLPASGERLVVLFGATGRLGRALARRLTIDRRRLLAVAHEIIPAGLPALIELLRDIGAAGGLDMVFAGGLTDPALAEPDLIAANVSLPLSVIDATRDIRDLRWLTVGSALEQVPALAASNPYLRSRRRLSETIQAQTSALGAERIVHLRLHTLYGGAPIAHMFLGQMADALACARPFAMSSGKQRREFHHVDDIAAAIVALLGRVWAFPDGLELAAGDAVRLGDLAEAVFGALGRRELLRVGSLATPAGEETIVPSTPSPPWLLTARRRQQDGVIAWLRAYLAGKSSLREGRA